MNTAIGPNVRPPRGWRHERPAPADREPPRAPEPTRDEPPAGRRPSPFLVALLRALSAWGA